MIDSVKGNLLYIDYTGIHPVQNVGLAGTRVDDDYSESKNEHLKTPSPTKIGVIRYTFVTLTGNGPQLHTPGTSSFSKELDHHPRIFMLAQGPGQSFHPAPSPVRPGVFSQELAIFMPHKPHGPTNDASTKTRHKDKESLGNQHHH